MQAKPAKGNTMEKNKNAVCVAVKKIWSADAVIAVMSAQKKGTYLPIAFEHEVGVAAGCADRVVKRTETVVRTGVSYASLMGAKNGAKSTPKPLAGGAAWIEYPYAIQGKNGVRIRFTKTKNPSQKPHVTWWLNGSEVSKDKLVGIVPEATLNASHNDSPIFDVKLSNIISIGKEAR